MPPLFNQPAAGDSLVHLLQFQINISMLLCAVLTSLAQLSKEISLVAWIFFPIKLLYSK